MTQDEENAKKLAEYHALFLTLDGHGQDAALSVLQSLSYAQSVLRAQNNGQPRKPPKRTA